MGFSATRGRVELEKGILQMFINLHDRSLVTTSIAVIGSTEDRYHIPVLTPVVAFHDQLMSSRNQCQSVVMVKSLGHVLTKCIAGSSRRNAPSAAIIRIRPQQVAHGS